MPLKGTCNVLVETPHDTAKLLPDGPKAFYSGTSSSTIVVHVVDVAYITALLDIKQKQNKDHMAFPLCD